MKKLVYTFLGLFLITQVNAQQDVHYSMFYTAPTAINPATAGVFRGDIRFVSNYRNQWSNINAKYRTITAGFDGAIRQKRSDNYWGAGFSFHNDLAGDGRMRTNDYNLNASYVMEVDRKSFLSFGLGIGMFQRGLDANQFSFNNQWNGESFDQGINSGEGGIVDNFIAFDLAAGIYYYSYFDDDFAYWLGASADHLTRPLVSFLGSAEKLYRKYSAHGGLEIPIPNSKIVIQPNALAFFQGPNRAINFGSDFRYIIRPASKRLVFNDEINLAFGAYYRLGDAAYFTGVFQYAGLKVGAAYDLTLSDLALANNGLGGYEVFISYTHAFGNKGGVSMFR